MQYQLNILGPKPRNCEKKTFIQNEKNDRKVLEKRYMLARASKIHPKTATQVEEILAIRSLKNHWQNLFLLSIDDILKGANH